MSATYKAVSSNPDRAGISHLEIMESFGSELPYWSYLDSVKTERI